MIKLFIFAFFLIALVCAVQGCNDCPVPSPVPVKCSWDGKNCGEDFADLDNVFSGEWKVEAVDYDFVDFVTSAVYGDWYNRVFRFQFESVASGSIVYPSLAALGVIAVFA